MNCKQNVNTDNQCIIHSVDVNVIRDREHQCVRFLICYIFGRRPKRGGAWPKWPSGKYATGSEEITDNNSDTVQDKE